MTIASEITKLNTNLTNSYTACENKGATLPASQNFDNLASTISAIPAGTSPTLASLTVTPSTTTQTLTPPSGTDGYNTVTVSAVTASIDSDIVAGNIKSGVNILGVSGTVTELVGTTTTITQNGTYAPTSPSNGFTSVSVNVAGTQPTGTYTITANGTYDVTNYASANVSVSGGSFTEQIITPRNLSATYYWYSGDSNASGVGNYSSILPDYTVIDKVIIQKYNGTPVSAVVHCSSGNYTYIGGTVAQDNYRPGYYVYITEFLYSFSPDRYFSTCLLYFDV